MTAILQYEASYRLQVVECYRNGNAFSIKSTDVVQDMIEQVHFSSTSTGINKKLFVPACTIDGILYCIKYTLL